MNHAIMLQKQSVSYTLNWYSNMEHESYKIGDHVRIVNYLRDNKMPVGIVENIDGAYIYVDVNIDNYRTGIFQVNLSRC